jgi:cyclopropane fatty-acyl-phospholipid synthase-like methyltransferase
MQRLLFPAIGLSLAAVGAARASAQSRPPSMEEMHQLHQDSKAYIAMLEDPTRDAYQKPREVVMALGLKEGDRIADVGAGAGYFALRFAHHVGDSGRVVAVDISPDMIVHLNQRVRDAGLDNVRTVLALPTDPLLAKESVDWVFICDTWHHIDDRAQYLAVLRKTLRPRGRIAIVDFHKRETPVGPPMEMRLSRDDVVREFEQGGFRLLAEHTFLRYQYFLVFAPIFTAAS